MLAFLKVCWMSFFSSGEFLLFLTLFDKVDFSLFTRILEDCNIRELQTGHAIYLWKFQNKTVSG
jgi:hypothetical protein